ncbi:MAG: DUF4815 domain-containing protein, partial [Bacteroidales bacterium]|nr:DUF4815 domain-containing protein [Bacteroidales bacterium]
MDYNITTEKYYNRTDEDSYKGIKQLLFRAGEILQNTEVNEVQELLHDQLKELSEEFIANGQVIEGADIDILYNSEPYIPSRIFEPKSMHMNTDGTKMFVLNTSVNAIYEFDLTSNYNISTAVFNHKKYDMSRYESHGKDFQFSNDGNKMFVIGKNNTEMHQFDLDAPFDVSKAKYKSKVKLHDLNPVINKAVNFQFGNNGSSLYVLDENPDDVNEDGVYKQYSLGNNFDVDTISVNNTGKHLKVKKDEADKDDQEVAGDFRPAQMKFNHDGREMFLLGTHSKNIQKFTLSSPYDISTSNFNTFSYSTSNTHSVENINEPTGMSFDNDGIYLTVVGSDNSISYQKELTVAWDFENIGVEAEYDTEQETLEVELRCGAGNIYFAEFFNEVSSTSLPLVAKSISDIENYNDEVGILLEFQEDSSLKDPAVEYDNFGQSGAYGLRFITEWKLKSVVNSEGINELNQEFIPIYKIVNGEIFPIIDISPLQKKIIDVSAKYDRNSNGNYVVGGYFVTSV